VVRNHDHSGGALFLSLRKGGKELPGSHYNEYRSARILLQQTMTNAQRRKGSSQTRLLPFALRAKEPRTMNCITNIWAHPRTSISGLLIGVVTVSSVLSQHGITLGNVGTGSIVSLLSGLATALLGLLARDPGDTTASTATSNATTRLGAWMLIALLLPLPWMTGCTKADVAQQIVNWTPTLENAVATVDLTVASLVPADAAILSGITASFDAASTLLTAEAKAYLADPSASTLNKLQSGITAFTQSVNSALLAAAKIKNTSSQKSILAGLNAVATISTAILILVQSVSSKAELAEMAAASPVKLAATDTLRDDEAAAQLLAAHYNQPVAKARKQVVDGKRMAVAAGF